MEPRKPYLSKFESDLIDLEHKVLHLLSPIWVRWMALVAKALPKAPAETQIRVASGVLAGSGFLLILLFGGMLGISFLTVILALAMVWEMSVLVLDLSDKGEKTRAILGATWLFIFFTLLVPRGVLEAHVILVMMFFLYFLLTAQRHQASPVQLRAHLTELMALLFAITYIAGFMAFLPMIRSAPYGLHWTILLFVIVWASDTGAYFGGRHFGGAKLYPAISPGKTRSGSLCAVVVSMVIALVYHFIFMRFLGVASALVIGALISIISQAGDLFESFLKRSFQVKDSGSLLPGHGGTLDRFDGVLFALPMMYLCTKLFTGGS